jgi:anti-sigma B factor antagonist
LLGVNESDDGIIVRFTSAKILDEGVILEIGDSLIEILDRASPTKSLMLDFKSVRFMSSAMIGKLVFLNKRAKAENVDLILCNIQPNVLEVFKITRLIKVFTIVERDLSGEGNSDS